MCPFVLIVSVERIGIVRPEKARRLQDYLIGAAQSGRLRGGSGEGGRLSEEDVIGMLEQISEQEAEHSTKISVLLPSLTLCSFSVDLSTIRMMSTE